jgi:hypothetical protein
VAFLGPNAIAAVQSVGLLTTVLLVLGAFALTASLVRRLVSAPFSTLELVRTFALSLVPIALAYHVAHFFAFLLVQGQRIVSLASDPFGVGWDVLGTVGHAVDVTVVSASTVWGVSVAAIVIGHVVAVYAAHVYAMRLFGERRRALLSQLPMAALMICYTMASLWIVAQPIAGR